MTTNDLLKQCTCAVLAFAIFMAGCGGSMANPAERYTPGDEKKSCNALYSEFSSIGDEIRMKQQNIKSRDTWNVVYFVTGCLVIVPFFFMDTKGSYEVEIDALKAREKQLKIYFAEKNCTPPGAVVPATAPAAPATPAAK